MKGNEWPDRQDFERTKVRDRSMIKSGEEVVITTCDSHCGGTCIFKVHVKDGIVTRIETDDGKEPQFRACVKGRAYRQRIYAPDRLKYPLKRVGERGEGKFKRISWDEALDTVAHELKRIKETFGPSDILYIGVGGDLASLHRAKPMHRVLCMFGGCSGIWGLASDEGETFAELATYGVSPASSSRENLLRSRLIIMWGWDPVSTIQATGTTWYLARALPLEHHGRYGASGLRDCHE